MRFSTVLLSFLATGVLASPALDKRNLPESVSSHNHNHMEYHLLKARERLAGRSTPAEEVMDRMHQLYGESQGTGPSDDWALPDNPLPQAQVQGHPQEQSLPEVVAPPPSLHVEENVVYITKTHVITNEPSPAPKAEAKHKAQPQTQPQSQPQEQPQEQPQPQPKPQSQPEQPPAQQNEQPQEQPQPQPEQPPAQQNEQPEPQPTTENNEEEPQPEPQPTEQEPAASPPTGSSGVSTDGLPMEFVPDLDTESPIYRGLAELHHNIHRQNHSLPSLVWNETLALYAKETAMRCIYDHSLESGDGVYGQSIAAGNAPGNISATLTNQFYNEEMLLFLNALGGSWGGDNPDMAHFKQWGHFSQMLWNGTTSFGCYTATCSPPGADPLDCDPSGNTYLPPLNCGNGGSRAYNMVCNYYPQGNFPNKYSSVPPPTGDVGFVQMTEDGVVGL